MKKTSVARRLAALNRAPHQVANGCRYVELIRVSSEGQAAKDTPEIQRSGLDRLRISRPGTLVERIEDGAAGLSGKLEMDERPDLQRLQVLARAGAFTEIRVWNLDRLTRNIRLIERARIWDLAERCGAVFVDCGGVELDPKNDMAELQFVIQTRANAKEIVKLAERASAGRVKCIGAGKKPCGPTSFGHQYSTKSGLWTVHEEQRAVFRGAMERCAGGASLNEVLDDLNASGALSPRGNGWSRSTLLRALTSRVCLGEYRFSVAGGEPTVIRIPPLVSQDLWDRAQAALRARATRTPGLNHRIEALFRGLLRCGECGETMHVYDQGAKFGHRIYYRCASKQFRTRRGCANGYHQAVKMDAVLWERVRGMLRDPEVTRDAATADSDSPGTWAQQAANCEGKLAVIKSEETATLRMLGKGLAAEACEEALTELARRRGVLSKSLEVARARMADIERASQNRQSLHQRSAEILRTVNSARTFSERRDVVLALVDPEACAVHRDGKIRLGLQFTPTVE